MNASSEPDWTADESLLYEAACNAIVGCEATDECSCFAVSVDYCFGDVTFCLDTKRNCARQAEMRSHRNMKNLDRLFEDPDSWRAAQYHIAANISTLYNPHTSEFKYPAVAMLKMSQWEQYFDKEEASDGADPAGHVIRLLYRLMAKVSNSAILSNLTMSSPFLLGFELPTDFRQLFVARIVNWPKQPVDSAYGKGAR